MMRYLSFKIAKSVAYAKFALGMHVEYMDQCLLELRPKNCAMKGHDDTGS